MSVSSGFAFSSTSVTAEGMRLAPHVAASNSSSSEVTKINLVEINWRSAATALVSDSGYAFPHFVSRSGKRVPPSSFDTDAPANGVTGFAFPGLLISTAGVRLPPHLVPLYERQLVISASSLAASEVVVTRTGFAFPDLAAENSSGKVIRSPPHRLSTQKVSADNSTEDEEEEEDDEEDEEEEHVDVSPVKLKKKPAVAQIPSGRRKRRTMSPSIGSNIAEKTPQRKRSVSATRGSGKNNNSRSGESTLPKYKAKRRRSSS